MHTVSCVADARFLTKTGLALGGLATADGLLGPIGLALGPIAFCGTGSGAASEEGC